MTKIKLDTDIPDVYSTTEAAKLLGMGYATLYRRIKAGEVQVIKIAGRTLITKSEIKRLVKRGKEKS